MRNLLVLLFFLSVSFSTAWAGIWKPITSQQAVPASVHLVSSDINTSVVHFKLDGFMLNEVKTTQGNAYTVSVSEGTPLLQKGAPDLAKLTATVIIPDMAMMDIEILSSSFVDYQNMNIAPSKGNLYRNVDPSKVAFEYGRPYSEDKFFPENIVSLREPFILRDYRGQTVIANPFQYNPVTKVLRVYTDIVVRVKPINNNGFNAIQRNGYPTRIDQDFAQLYQNTFLNTTSFDYTPVSDQGRMLIISHANYMAAMQPFVDWKNKMGIQTEIVNVATIGTTSSAIKDFVSNYYTTNGLTFLLLVGDAPQIPTNTSGNLGGPSDVAYGYLLGNDHNPEIFVGRFSAETVDHVTTMVQRTLEYEQQPLTTTNWFDKGFGIASDQGPGDDGEYDYTHMQNIRADLIGYTYAAIGELYDGSQGGEDQAGNPTASMVSTEVNAGRSIINYVGHGSDVSWGTTGFSNTNINSLSNNHMWPFIWSVACVNGNFVSQTCFAEAWLRAKNATGPTGAVATLMSTINQSWNPPMDGQDEMNDILVESYPTNIKRSFGGLSMNGCIKMNETYGSQGDEMTDTWTLFGDPSVMVRTANPVAISATHENQIFLGSTSFVINTPVEGALVALSKNNQLITSGFVAGGSVTLTFPAFQSPDTADVVITAYNHIPYMASIAIIPNNGPYLIYNANTIQDANSNNNGRADYGETVNLSLALTNIGVLPATDVQVQITSNDSYITLIDNMELYPMVPEHDTIAVDSGFSFSLSNATPDLHVIPFQFTATAGTEVWNGSFTVTAHAGILKYLSFVVDDAAQGNGNGKADANEIFDLVVKAKNTGSAPATNVFGQISFNDPYLSLLSSPVQSYGNMAENEVVTRTYTVQSGQNAPSGHIVPCQFLLNADLNLSSLSTFNVVIGQIPVAVIDLDKNNNSGPSILSALNANSVYAEYKTTMPGSLSGYQTLFVCLGVGTKKHVLSTADGQKLANFLNAGGKLYMEGGDTWYYDPKTAVHPMFKANGVMDGGSDLSTETGQTGQFAEGLSYTYTGDKDFIDHISPLSPAFSLFKNMLPIYISAVGYDAGTYRTIASAFEFGGLANGDAPSTRNEYMRRIIDFFGILSTSYTTNFMGTPIAICENDVVTYNDYSTTGTNSWLWSFPGGNPETSTEQNPSVVYSTPGTYQVTLITSNGTFSDTLVKENYVWVQNCLGDTDATDGIIRVYPNPVSSHVSILFAVSRQQANISIADATGRVLFTQNGIETSQAFTLDMSGFAEGVYFATLKQGAKQTVKKIIVRR